MALTTFHSSFQWDRDLGLGWQVIFADGFVTGSPANPRGEIVSGSPQEWVFRGTSHAGAFAGWTVSLRPREGSSFSNPSSYSNLPSGFIGHIEIRNSEGQLVASVQISFAAYSIASLSYADLLANNDAFVGSAGVDHFNGGGGNDELDGGAGNDVLKGGFGRDALIGGAGDDVLDGGDGNDEIHGGDGIDTVRGGAGDDHIHWTTGDTIDAGDGYDRISFSLASSAVVFDLDTANAERADGSAYDDQLTGGALEGVWLDGADGDDRLTGGIGNDDLYGDTGFDHVGDDILEGGSGDDNLYGWGGDDILVGGEGRDRLDAGTGFDEIYGGDGDDYIWVQGNFDADFIDAGEGADFIRTTDGGSLLGGGGDDVMEVGVPTAGDFDVTHGLIDGGDGYDTITIFANGFQTVRLGVLEDGAGFMNFESVSLVFGSNTLLVGTSAAESLAGDRVRGGGGDDRLYGDELYGEGGDDTLQGTIFAERLDGGDGTDVVSFDWYSTAGQGVQADLGAMLAPGGRYHSIEGLVGARFADHFTGSGGDDWLSGRDGDDSLTGLDGHDRLDGEAGSDTVDGGSGDDVLEGGLGNDLIVGGNGTDVAVFSGLAGSYLIVAEGDGYRVKGADGSDFVSGVELLRFDDLTIDLLKIVCDPVSGRVLVGEDAPLVLPEDERAPSKSGDADPLGPPVSLDPLVLLTGLDPKASDSVRPEICPADDAGHFSGLSRPLLDLDALGLSTFDGRDPHRLMLQPASYDWIV